MFSSLTKYARSSARAVLFVRTRYGFWALLMASVVLHFGCFILLITVSEVALMLLPSWVNFSTALSSLFFVALAPAWFLTFVVLIEDYFYFLGFKRIFGPPHMSFRAKLTDWVLEGDRK